MRTNRLACEVGQCTDTTKSPLDREKRSNSHLVGSGPQTPLKPLQTFSMEMPWLVCRNGVTSEFGKNSTLMRAMPSNGAAFRCHSFLKTIFFVVLETRLIQRLITRVLFEKISLYASTGVGRFLTDTSQKRSFARGQTMPAAYRTIFSVF